MTILTKWWIPILGAAALLAQPPGGPIQSGDGIWLRNAYYGEQETFDSCFGHQPGNGEYHHHVQPVCLRAQLDDNIEAVSSGRTGTIYRVKASGWRHSPILGWAFDGYPIYGPYGYSDARDAASPIARIASSFRLRDIAQRDSLPDWVLSFHSGVSQQLTSAQRGPAVSERFPLGRYLEDYDYVPGLGDLDQYNGRFTVTPEYPNGTYAYYVTIDDEGKPAFPYIFALQYYGVTGGPGRAVPADAQDYFSNGQFTGAPGTQDTLLKSWMTQNSQTPARAVVGWDPSAGPQTTWPGTQPAGARTAGSVTTPANADVQRIRTTAGSVYVNSNNLPSYVIGPWFMSANGGVFVNFPSGQNFQQQVPRNPQSAAGARTATGMGAVGVWVNGVGAFNSLDGASYKNSAGDDAGGGIVSATAFHASSASLEGGPVTPGSLVTARANYDAKLATTTEQASGANWPLTLGGATVTIRDSAGSTHQAAISYASPTLLTYRVPEAVAAGVATVTISAGGQSVPGGLNIVQTYPGLFKPDSSSVTPGAPLVLNATGLNSSKDVTVTVGGETAQVTYAGPDGTVAGLDRISAVIPPSMAGKGKVEVVVTAGGKPSNPVYVVIE